MGRTLIAVRVAELHRQMHEAEKNRQIVLSKINTIKESCVNKEITYSEYEKKLSTLVSGKTLPQWIEYYDSYIALCKVRIENLHSQHKKSIYKNYFLFAFSIIVILLFFKLNITGFVVSNQESNSSIFIENLDYFFSNNSQNAWSQSNAGQIISVSFSGKIYGEGNAKIFFDDYLISDIYSKQKEISLGAGLTGFAISEEYTEESFTNQSQQQTEGNSPSHTQPLSAETNISEISTEEISQKSQSTESESPSHTSSQTQDIILENVSSNQSQQQPEEATLIESPSHTPRAAETNSSEPVIVEKENSTNEIDAINNQQIEYSFTFNCNNECILSHYSINQIEHTIRVELDNVNLSISDIKYEIITTMPENTIINETLTLESPIIIEQPVQWKKEITVDKPGEINLEIPEQAKSISISSLDDSLEKVIVDSVDPSKEKDKKDKNKEIILDAKSNSYEVLYETPAPTIQEEILSENQKEVIISAPDELNYTNVVSFTTLPSPISIEQANKIKLYWEVNGTQIEHPFTINDTNEDGLVDILQWITPHLSEQKFIIIIITKAEHLDSNKEFISDIYESVKKLDSNWSETINNSEYVRVVFESKLNNKNDITIFPRFVSGNPIVEVYELDSDLKIAEFTNINQNQYNKIFLTNLLSTEQDTFDLKIVGGSIEFDHIIDPTPKVLPSGTRNGMFVVSNSTSQLPNYFMWNGSNWSQRYEALSVGGIPEWMTIRAGPTRDEYILATADNVDDINIQINFTNSSGQKCWGNGTACNVVWEVNATSTTANVQKVDVAYSHISGNALVVWTDNSRRPLFTVWNGSYWSRPRAINDTAVSNIGSLALTGTNIETIQLAARTNNSDEIALLLTDSNDDSAVVIWNGTGFDCESPVLSIALGTTDVQKADLDYEDLSGDLFIASIASATRFNITTKAAGTCSFTTTPRTVLNAVWMDLAAQPGTDNIILAGSTGGTTDDMNAQVWRGSAWGNVSAEDTTVYANAANPNAFFSAAWAGLKAGLVVYSDAANTALDWFHFNATSMAWQGAPATDFTPTPAFSSTGESNIRAYSFIDENKTFAFLKDANTTHAKVWAKIYNAETNTWTNTEPSQQPLIWNASNTATFFPTFDFTWQKYITPPALNIIYPANATYNINVSQLNYTRESTADYCWYSTNNGQTNSSPSATCSNFTGVQANEGSNTWILYVNDSSGVWDSVNITFFQDSIKPLVQFGTGTEQNNSLLNRSNVLVNVTASDTHLANITINIYNSTQHLINTSNSSTSPFVINFTNLESGNYKFNASAYDFFGNVNNTPTYNISIQNEFISVNSCKTLEVDGAYYKQTANIVPTSNGNCFNITANNIVFDGNGYWIKNETYSTPTIFVKGVNNLTIRGLNITTSESIDSNPINITNTNNSYIYNNSIRKAGPIIINNSNNNTFEENIITLVTSGIEDYEGNNNKFIKNIISKTSISSGILITNSNNTLISNNQINDTNYDNYYDGIYIYNNKKVYDNNITNNIIYNSSIAAWGDGQNNSNLIIFNNSAYNCEFTGVGAISLYGDLNNTLIINNTVENAADSSIYVWSTFRTIIRDNYLNNSDTGIEATNTNENNFTNNYILNSTYYGIYVSGNKNLIKDNNIIFSSYGIFISSNDNYSIVSENEIINMSIDGIRIDSGNNKIEIINNTFKYISGNGILVFPTSYNVHIVNNTFTNLLGIYSDAVVGGKYVNSNYIINSTNGITGNSKSGENGTISNNFFINVNEDILTIVNVNITVFNNTVINASNSAVYLKTYSSSSFNNSIFVDQYIENYTLGSGNIFSVENTNLGKISFIEIIGNTSGKNFTNDLKILNNSLIINNTLNGLNKSANITLRGIKSNWIDPALLIDNLYVCDETTTIKCSNFTSLNAGNVEFNVSSWSQNFSVGERPIEENIAPEITSVFVIPDQSITENSKTEALINFTVQDLNGYSDINTSTAKINLTRTGDSTVRQNNTCIRYQQGGTLANYSCTLDIWYFDSAGEWNISIFISDNSYLNATNTSTNLTVLQTSAFVSSPNAVTFSSISPGTKNTTSINSIILNNTGNKPITSGNIQINATHLLGEADPTKGIYAGNFSVGTQTGSSDECGATGSTLMTHANFAGLTGATLPRGNHSVNDGNTGQEQLYVCIKEIGAEITAQAYSTSQEGSWTIKILVIAITFRRRNKIKQDRLSKIICLLKVEINNSKLNIQPEIISQLEAELAKKYKVTINEIKELTETVKEIEVPLSVFSSELGALEAISLYLKDRKLLKFNEIAELLNRDQRTIWTAYTKAKEKRIEISEKAEINIPIETLSNANITLFESLIKYLKEDKEMRYSKIAELLNRDQRNIWTMYHRVSDRKMPKSTEKSKKNMIERIIRLIKEETKENATKVKINLIDILLKQNRKDIEIEQVTKKATIASIKVPISIFSSELGALEAITLYLKEKYQFRFKEIAEILQRNEKTVWTAYSKAKDKNIEIEEQSDIDVDIDRLVNPDLTIFECLIKYLKEKKDMKYVDIAEILNREQRNIWTIYNRTIQLK